MSDFKSKFAAAKAQRKSAAPSREQLKALRAQKAAALASAPSQTAAALQQSHRDEPNTEDQSPHASTSYSKGPPPPRPPQAARTEQPPSPQQASGPAEIANSGLPAGFFDEAEGSCDRPLQPLESVSRADGSSTAPQPADVADIGPAANGSSAAGLPEGFFDAASPTVTDVNTNAHGKAPVMADSHLAGPRSGSATAPIPSVRQIQGSQPARPLPKDFFADKDAGAKASGLPVQKKKTPAEQMAEFNKAVAGDVLAAEEADEVEATDFAAERAAREAFEQRQRLAAVEELRHKAAAARQCTAEGSVVASPTSSAADPFLSGVVPNGVLNGSSDLPARSGKGERPLKRRKCALDVFDDSGSSSSEENSDAALDWRAKAL